MGGLERGQLGGGWRRARAESWARGGGCQRVCVRGRAKRAEQVGARHMKLFHMRKRKICPLEAGAVWRGGRGGVKKEV